MQTTNRLPEPLPTATDSYMNTPFGCIGKHEIGKCSNETLGSTKLLDIRGIYTNKALETI